ncbi:MAG: tRNA (adenosine(37)-N6)-dimethylallyltransferase MiaA [Deltaproteobacteria bacterium]|nr:tRNA (adenosine(37)-N6)-dimethylallyltransferase MiaA [Deltaproteobacteria bacterium]
MSHAHSNFKKIVVIGGPTCSGKSDLALYLAEKFDGEIVNADSMQVYRYFDIGTAKPEEEVRLRIPHHVLDVVNPNEEFDAKRFLELADEAISLIIQRGKLPIVVGGTGLYIRALIYGLFEAKKDEMLRRKLQEEFNKDPKSLFERLRKIDEEYAKKISPNDGIRIVRALEIYETTGKNMSQWERIHGFKYPRYNALFLGLKRERKDLYSRIDKRVENMIKNGWIDEVRNILLRGFSKDIKPLKGIGYSEILRYLCGELTYPDMIRIIKKKTRNYAKRQIIWFSKEKNINWFVFPEEKERIVTFVKNFLEL